MPTLTKSDIAELSAPERLSLIAELWDSLSDEQTPLPEAQREELERRLATFEEDRANAMTWDSLKAELNTKTP